MAAGRRTATIVGRRGYARDWRNPMDDVQARRIAELIAPFKVAAGSEVVLGRDFDPADTGDFVHEEDSKALLAQGVDFLAHYQSRLAAQDTYGVLVVLQALDAGGKDST